MLGISYIVHQLQSYGVTKYCSFKIFDILGLSFLYVVLTYFCLFIM